MKKIRQKFFVARELQHSILMLILFSFLTAAFFMYLVKFFGESIKNHGVLSFFLIMGGYAVVVTFLTFFFAHRFIGPFERLKMELDIVLSGDYHRRLSLRARDDIYVRSFIEKVNEVIGLLDRTSESEDRLLMDVYEELDVLIGNTTEGDAHREELSRLRDKLNKCMLRSQ